MNNYSYPFIPNNNLNILEELIKINETLNENVLDSKVLYKKRHILIILVSVEK